MNRFTAIRTIVSALGDDELIIHANGAISRESYHCKDRGGNFYLLGSMGLPAAVALGIALANPSRPVGVFDGDGNVLMGLGALTIVGANRPRNFVHVVLDNQAYGTTGDQATVSSHISLCDIALASGYRKTFRVEKVPDLARLLPGLFQSRGPVMVHIRVNREIPVDCPRIPHTAAEIRQRFESAIMRQKV